MTDFEFKDSQTGWAGGSNTSCEGIVIKTTNGGMTWFEIATKRCPPNLLYDKRTDRLWQPSGLDYNGGLWYSDDEGATWLEADKRAFSHIAMSETGNMLLGGAQILTSTYPPTHFMYSEDGVSWKESSLQSEGYSICNSGGIIVAIARDAFDQCSLVQSLDNGETWTTINGSIDSVGRPVQIAANTCFLYLQSNKGFFKSDNNGVTWIRIGDVSTTFGKFHLQENVAYLPRRAFNDNAWEPAELWRYIEPVELAVQNPLVIQSCEIDTLVTLTYNSDCFKGELLSAEIIQPSDRFTLGSLSLPQDVSGDFSIPFSYSSLAPGSTDNASLKLRFRAGAYIFDTVISITAQSGAGASSVGFVTRVSNASPKHGEKTVVGIYPTEAASARGLNEVTFDVSYHDDLFRFEQISGSYQPSVTNKTLTTGTITLPISISATDITLEPNVPIAEIELTAMLTDTTSTDITISNVMLNGGDQDFARCMLALEESTGAELSVSLRCGDPLIQRVMRGQQAIEIKSINPNPASGKITVDYESKLSGGVTLAVYSVSGVLVHEEVLASDRGDAAVQIDASVWASGAFTIVLKSGEEEARGGVIKN
jgi:hypothetical protein